MKKKDLPRYGLRLDPNLLKKLKIYCINHDVSMQTFIEGLIIKELEKFEKEAPN